MPDQAHAGRVEVADSSRPRGGAPLMTAVLLLIALPALVASAGDRPGSPDVPPSLDRFLAAVRAATPPSARILVAGNPPALAVYRATYALYPRAVLSAVATDYTHAAAAPVLAWRNLERIARRDRVQYVLLWRLNLAPPKAVRVRMDGGMLAGVSPG